MVFIPTHERHSISPVCEVYGGCLLWVFWKKNHSGDTRRPSHWCYFDRIRNSLKLWNVLVYYMLSQSQRNFVYVTTVTLTWRVQNFVTIGWVYSKPEHCKFWSNLEFDRNIVSRAVTRKELYYVKHGCSIREKTPQSNIRYDITKALVA